MKKHTILLVDDHALVRAGIKSLIDKIADFVVTDEASSVGEALSCIEKLRPDIVITDITMGEQNGLDLCREVKERHPDISLIILSMHANDEIVSEALRLGASSYLLKEAAPAELEIALQAATRGETYLSPAVSTRIIQRLVHQPAASSGLSVLTARQIEILTLIASRKGTKEIAYQLDLSEKTIAAHRSQIMDRLGVRDVVGLTLFAVKHGLVKAMEA